MYRIGYDKEPIREICVIKLHSRRYFSRREELKHTRDQASELLESIPPERIEKIDSEKVLPHPEEVLIMAD